MAHYISRRLAQSILVILGVTIISFGVVFMTGDPAALMLGGEGLPPEVIEAFRREMGFDRPWLVQYCDYMQRVLRGDLGRSYYHGVSNAQLIRETMPATILLAVVSTILTLAIGIPIGVLSAFKRNTRVDRLAMAAAIAGQSMPGFWLGIMLILIVGERLRWLPVSGVGSFQHIILPAVTLSMVSVARNARMVRSSMLEVLGQDYIRTARAKGLMERAVIYKHALKNALIPVVTLIGMDIGHRLGGAVVVETIFAWPGVGRMVIQSINSKDIPLLQACMIVLALIFVGINLLVDVLYVYIDPRIRHS